ncbi:hypothetical protein JI743_10615 [Sphingopyxis sp. DHUNG17]|uniref:hypothetical protein n=1 Tax=Sphingopyxis jiangsuensis TaxID=2871171 RepID=UPI001920268D|nr:hypothetical protein [Sphingopyxis lutea]MBL0769261.1 hypothetical protein [Sphingopyxis lutea]
MASIWKSAIALGAALAAAASQPLAAQEEVAVEAGKPWNHAPSGISVPATIDGIARGRVTRFDQQDLDVAASFFRGSPQEALTVYVFRNTNGNASVWLSQAQGSIENGKSFGTPSLAIAPATFAPTAQSGAIGVHAVYALTGTDYRSAGVAIFPVGDWYVKVRASSTSRSPAENAAWMKRVIGALILPTLSAGAAATPVIPCSTPLGAANSADSTATQGAGISQPSDRIVAAQWCRETRMEGNRAVYRPVGTTDRYLFAIGDNGNAVTVRGEGGYYSGNLITAAKSFALPPQTALPTPQRVLELMAADKAVGVFDTWPPRR